MTDTHRVIVFVVLALLWALLGWAGIVTDTDRAHPALVIGCFACAAIFGTVGLAIHFT